MYHAVEYSTRIMRGEKFYDRGLGGRTY